MFSEIPPVHFSISEESVSCHHHFYRTFSGEFLVHNRKIPHSNLMKSNPPVQHLWNMSIGVVQLELPALNPWVENPPLIWLSFRFCSIQTNALGNSLYYSQMRRMYGLFTYMKGEKWLHSRGNVPGDSKWPFDPLVGGHLTFPKGHLTIPKRSQRIAR